MRPSELEDMLQFTAETWEDIPYHSFTCPLEVLHAIIHTNYLRASAPDEIPRSELVPAPEAVLSRLTAFSPEVWAACRPCAHDGWLLIARAHHSAAVLYLISTLGPRLLASSLQEVELVRAVHASRLRSALKESEPLSSVRIGTLWPLIVAGVEVAPGDGHLRSLVRKRLDRLADDLATPLMVEAREVLEGYWASGREGWDECFDRPYAFVL